MVPLTATRSPALAVERRSSWPVATVPKAVTDNVSGPGVAVVSPPMRAMPNSA